MRYNVPRVFPPSVTQRSPCGAAEDGGPVTGGLSSPRHRPHAGLTPAQPRASAHPCWPEGPPSSAPLPLKAHSTLRLSPDTPQTPTRGSGRGWGPSRSGTTLGLAPAGVQVLLPETVVSGVDFLAHFLPSPRSSRLTQSAPCPEQRQPACAGHRPGVGTGAVGAPKGTSPRLLAGPHPGETPSGRHVASSSDPLLVPAMAALPSKGSWGSGGRGLTQNVTITVPDGAALRNRGGGTGNTPDRREGVPKPAATQRGSEEPSFWSTSTASLGSKPPSRTRSP